MFVEYGTAETKPVWQLNDGGRAAAGFKGLTRDCVTRAIAIAAELPYKEVYDAMNNLAKTEKLTSRKRRKSASRTGVYRDVYEIYLEAIGWEWVATKTVGSRNTVHLRADELPTGRIICRVTSHLCAVIDGVIHDTHDPSRSGTRTVYGYYRKRAN